MPSSSSRRASAAGAGPSVAPLARPLATLKGVGPQRAAALARVGLRTIEDLLVRFPLRYEDRAHVVPIRDLEAGTTMAVQGEVVEARWRPTRRAGFSLVEVRVRDATGRLPAIWFNQPYLRQVFHTGQRVVLYGKVDASGAGLQLTNPEYELFDADADPHQHVHTGRIVPVYEKIGSLTTKVQRLLVWQALEQLPGDLDDPVPASVRERLGLLDRRTALGEVHFPSRGPIEALQARRSEAHRRLVFEEFFAFQVGLALRQRRRASARKPWTIAVGERLRARVRMILPFTLTHDQRQVLKEIVDDMRQPSPMHRLLQGDVGSGKTIVACVAALVAIDNGLQVAFMAPTEILAEQHYLTLQALMARAAVRMAVVSGHGPASARRAARAAVADGQVDLVVGTHALAQESTAFKRLGLVIIDEQHRFGVLQRAHVQAKGVHPDVLVMTATPIPRTMALTAYGDLELSLIRTLPPGRTPIVTTVRPESRRTEIYRYVRAELEKGRQAYVIYPLIEESDKVEVRAATEMADHLAHDVWPEFRVGLLHGRLPSEAKASVMAAFASGALHVLVATSVVEVGIDVPNASVMVVEHAERFGLAQLHQLRGRVGRGAHASSCVFLYQPPLSETARERLKALADTTDGFALAERDLQIRGPGDFFGTRQSGMPHLRVGDLQRDEELLSLARIEARAFAGANAPGLEGARWDEQAWANHFGLVDVG